MAAAAAKSLQSCLTLCDPIDGSPPGPPVPGILQARTLERVAISFSNAWKWKVTVKSPSRVWLFTTPWTVAHQAPPFMGFSRQEYWSGGVPMPSPNLIIWALKITDLSPPGSRSQRVKAGERFDLLLLLLLNCFSRVWLFATPWTAAYQSPPSMRFSRQEYWSGLPLPSPDLTYYCWLKNQEGYRNVQNWG